MGFFGNGKRIPDGQCSGFSMTTIPGNVLRLPHVPPTELDSIADQAGLLPVLNGMGSYYLPKIVEHTRSALTMPVPAPRITALLRMADIMPKPGAGNPVKTTKLVGWSLAPNLGRLPIDTFLYRGYMPTGFDLVGIYDVTVDEGRQPTPLRVPLSLHADTSALLSRPDRLGVVVGDDEFVDPVQLSGAPAQRLVMVGMGFLAEMGKNIPPTLWGDFGIQNDPRAIDPAPSA
ncbi:hypothetical protein KA016_01005 [Candidatus Saccharibacteria bacterium]|jgi:hypothetical protein|nr:hypothetical protein [Candidatus Saccharibacteria bacterium]